MNRAKNRIKMKEFFRWNIAKLKFTFVFTSIIFLTIVLIIFAIGLLQGQVPSLPLFLTVLLGAGIGMPALILLIGITRGLWDLHKRRKAFNKEPYSALLTKGFVVRLKHEHNRWQLTEPVLAGTIDEFTILAEVDTQHAPGIIRFQALTEITARGYNDRKRLTSKYDQDSIELDYDGVTKKLSLRNSKFSHVEELMKELNHFVHTIKRDGFVPATEPLENYL